MDEESKSGSAVSDNDSVVDQNNENELTNEVSDELNDGGKKALSRAVEREKKAKDEARRFQAERDALKSEKEQAELRSLEENGRVQEANEILKRKAVDSERKYNDYVAQTEVQKISDKLKLLAIKEGASHPEDVVQIFMPRLNDKSLREVDEGLLGDLVNEAKQSRPGWFKRDVSINDMPPRNTANLEKKSVNNMSISELKAEYAKRKKIGVKNDRSNRSKQCPDRCFIDKHCAKGISGE